MPPHREFTHLREVKKMPPTVELIPEIPEPDEMQLLPPDADAQIQAMAEKNFDWDKNAIGGQLFGEPNYSVEDLQKYFYPEKSTEELRGILTYAERYKRVENAMFKRNQELEKELDDLASICDIFPEIVTLVDQIKIQHELFLAAYEKHCTLTASDTSRATEQNKLYTLEEINARLAVIDRAYTEKFNQVCQKKLGWLVDRALSDVQMYLIRQLNTSGIAPDKAQEILQQKIDGAAPVFFEFRPHIKALAEAFPYQKGIIFNIAHIPRLAHDQVNEALVEHTLVHEYTHTVSHGFDDPERQTPIGVSDETIFGGPQFMGDRFFSRTSGPENFLNELVTEMTALAITKKHYSDNPPGVRDMRRNPTQKVWSYDFLIQPFIQLEQKYGNKYKELLKLLEKVMIQGGIDEIKEFFAAEPALYADTKKICERGIKLCVPN